MKKSLKFSLLAAVIAVGAISCKDEETTEEPKTDAELIKGEWAGVSARVYAYNTASNDTAMAMEMPAGFINYSFQDEGAFQAITMGDTATGSFELDGTMLTMLEGEDTLTYEITTLDETKLNFQIEEQDGDDRYEEYYEFQKN